MGEFEKRVEATRLLKKVVALLEEPVVYTSTWIAVMNWPDLKHTWSVPRKGWLAKWLGAKDHYGYTADGKKYLLTSKGWILCSPSS